MIFSFIVWNVSTTVDTGLEIQEKSNFHEIAFYTRIKGFLVGEHN